MLTVVMYHYVRDLARSRYPNIKGLDVKKFEGQLAYFQKHYHICSLHEVQGAMRGTEELPTNALLLTFDDGFIDHYLTVFPRLAERGLPGCFFPPARPIEEGTVLDVHKTHFILASTEDHAGLVQFVIDRLQDVRQTADLPGEDALRRQYLVPNRFDPPEVNFVKRTLQHALPEAVRGGITDALFRQFVSRDEEAFARELYVDKTQLRLMARHGMAIGGHGYMHYWLDKLSAQDQETEIRRTLAFLETIYEPGLQDWAMVYPYGAYNAATIDLLKQYRCSLAFTTKADVVHDFCSPWTLCRLDTVHLPFSPTAEYAPWTVMSQAPTV